MKAARITQYGPIQTVEVVSIDTPSISDDQVLVEVHASSLNPFDTTIREGYMKDMIPLEFPLTLGGDIAGTVAEVGGNVTGFVVGDSVYGQANVVGGNSGAFAEFAATKAGSIAKMPGNLDYISSASLPLAAVSALQGLTQHINLQADQKIFVHGGAGGIGSIAIQIAKHIGAHVATTATGDQIETVTALGADQVIDYKAQDFAELLSDYDAVFDTVGGDDFAKSLTVLKKDGIAVSMIAQPDETKADELSVTALMQQTQVTTAMLDELRELVESGAVNPLVDQVFSLGDIQAAFNAKETGTVRGKVVLKIKE